MNNHQEYTICHIKTFLHSDRTIGDKIYLAIYQLCPRYAIYRNASELHEKDDHEAYFVNEFWCTHHTPAKEDSRGELILPVYCMKNVAQENQPPEKQMSAIINLLS